MERARPRPQARGPRGLTIATKPPERKTGGERARTLAPPGDLAPVLEEHWGGFPPRPTTDDQAITEKACRGSHLRADLGLPVNVKAGCTQPATHARWSSSPAYIVRRTIDQRLCGVTQESWVHKRKVPKRAASAS